MITLNVNGLNAPTKRQGLAKWIQKQDQELTVADHELLIAKFTLKVKKVGKTTRPFK